MATICFSCSLAECDDIDKLKRNIDACASICSFEIPPFTDGSVGELMVTFGPRLPGGADVVRVLLANHVKLDSGVVDELNYLAGTWTKENVPSKKETEDDDCLSWLRSCERVLPKAWRDGALGDLMEDIVAMKEAGIPRTRIRLIVIGQIGVLAICALVRLVVTRVVSAVIGS